MMVVEKGRRKRRNKDEYEEGKNRNGREDIKEVE